jgi:hypothetical protein
MSSTRQNHPKRRAIKALFLPSRPPSLQKNQAPAAVAVKVGHFSAAC